MKTKQNPKEVKVTPNDAPVTAHPPTKSSPSQAWDLLAEGYDQYVSPTEDWLAKESLRAVGLQKGDSFLDVAAGCGGLSLPAARLGARVMATDWSPKMIELFKRHVREERLANAEGRVMEGHHLDFEDNSFDFCGSQFGVMLFDKQAEALKEMVRVCKKGGKVFLIAYGAYQEMEFLNFFINSIQQLRPEFEGIPADHPPLEFQVSDPKVLESRLRDAGLRQVRVLQRTEKLEFQSAQQLWDWILYGNPIPGQILKNLDISTDETKVVRAQIGTLLEERKRSQGAPILTNPINIGYGIK